MNLQDDLFTNIKFNKTEFEKMFEDIKPHIVKKFFKFHAENPELFELYKKFSNDVLKSGRKRYGIASITERIRWHYAIETTGDDFKINNNHKSCYVRLLIFQDKRFEKLFQLRTLMRRNKSELY